MRRLSCRVDLHGIQTGEVVYVGHIGIRVTFA